MAGSKPGVNPYAFLDSSDPGDKRLPDFDAKPEKPAINLVQDLFGQAYAAYPSSAQGKQAMANSGDGSRARASAASNKAQGGGAKHGGYTNSSGASRKHGVSVKNKASSAQGPQAPRLYDINEFPSLKQC